MGRRDARVDANQPEIVRAFREHDCSVQHLHAVGQGCPDLLVGKHGINLLVEVKSEAGKLTDDQKKFADRWRGQFCVCRSREEALALVHAIECGEFGGVDDR